MKRLLALALTLALVPAGIAAAASLVAAGKFKGKTSKSDPMGLRVDGQDKIRDLYFEGVKMKCKDGYSFNTPTGKKHRAHLKLASFIQDGGRWLTNDDNWDPYGVYVDNGQFTPNGSQTTGQVHISTTLSKNHKKKGGLNRPDFCDSGSLTFTLKRK